MAEQLDLSDKYHFHPRRLDMYGATVLCAWEIKYCTHTLHSSGPCLLAEVSCRL